jgi:uncharacterized membrane protein YebE (DUF533 family)
LGNAVNDYLDRASDELLAPHVAWMESEVSRLRESFDFAKAVEARRLSPNDRDLVAITLYRNYLGRCWQDARLSERERELLAWLAKNLGLSAAKVSHLNERAAVDVFRMRLGQAFADGKLDEAEKAQLAEVAAACDRTVDGLMQTFCAKEGDDLLRSVFADMASDGQLHREEWRQFRETVALLGIPKDQVLKAIRIPAQKLVEHTLADARSDDEITEREEQVLNSLLDNLIDDHQFALYVRGELAEVKEMQNLARGLLPSIAAPSGVALRSGEIVHWAGKVVFERVRELSKGPKVETASGDLVVTDSRAIFESPGRSMEINHRRILAHYPFGSRIEIRSGGKGAGSYEFGSGGERPVAIWETAIRRANQTIVAGDDKDSRRRIPRDVRQRVWQKYGGRCAECSADTYLEFDHIIPVAKGGGNSDTNVQLLCRNCNLAKSDNI